MKCTKIDNARAQLLLCSLNLLFGDVPVAVAAVVCLSSLLFLWRHSRVLRGRESGESRMSG